MTFLAAQPDDDPVLRRCIAALNDLLGAARPEQVLLVAGPGEADVVPASGAPCHIELYEADAGERPARRYDAAVLFRVDGPGRVDEATHLLAALRDVHARQLLVVPGGGWSREELLGLGLTRCAAFGEEGERQLEIFGFDLARYKKTPDWLNSRDWAHPELFGKYRW